MPKNTLAVGMKNNNTNSNYNCYLEYLNLYAICSLDRNPWTAHFILQKFPRSCSRSNSSKPIAKREILKLKLDVQKCIHILKNNTYTIMSIAFYLHGITTSCSQATRLCPSAASEILSTFELRYDTPDSTHLGRININYISTEKHIHEPSRS